MNSSPTFIWSLRVKFSKLLTDFNSLWIMIILLKKIMVKYTWHKSYYNHFQVCNSMDGTLNTFLLPIIFWGRRIYFFFKESKYLDLFPGKRHYLKSFLNINLFIIIRQSYENTFKWRYRRQRAVTCLRSLHMVNGRGLQSGQFSSHTVSSRNI